MLLAYACMMIGIAVLALGVFLKLLRRKLDLVRTGFVLLLWGLLDEYVLYPFLSIETYYRMWRIPFVLCLICAAYFLIIAIIRFFVKDEQDQESRKAQNGKAKEL